MKCRIQGRRLKSVGEPKKANKSLSLCDCLTMHLRTSAAALVSRALLEDHSLVWTVGTYSHPLISAADR
ncbi:hypothetical protein Sjap_009566 [Stephania japonica]|uniref:Uncharacterized protein n=1 Tax=Stephania japonica TaxID=461633 RepID=A0AAP0JRP9_9MAGN